MTDILEYLTNETLRKIIGELELELESRARIRELALKNTAALLEKNKVLGERLDEVQGELRELKQKMCAYKETTGCGEQEEETSAVLCSMQNQGEDHH